MTKQSARSMLTLQSCETLVDLVDSGATRWKSKPLLVFDATGSTLSFTDFAERSEDLALVFASAGVRRGDRVAVMLRNRPEFPLCWIALARIGAVLVPLNVYYKETDASYILNHAEARVLVTERGFLQLAKRLRERVSALETLISVDPVTERGVQSVDAVPVDAALRGITGEIHAETSVNIQYTSGTTGHPKGCVLSNCYWVRLARIVCEGPPPLGEEDILLTAQPFYYMDPQWNVAAALHCGATLIVLDRFHPSTFWSKVRTYDVSFFYCLGMMPAALYSQPESLEDQSHRVRAVMCSAIPVRLHSALEARWGVPWYEAFGMTETGGDVRISPRDHKDTVGLACIGRAYVDREVRIVDDEGRAMPRGASGEMLLRGPGMMDGYFNDPTETDRVFRGGWFHTGDIVRMDDEGRIFYLGRLKDVIRRSGENISSAEVEGVIMEHLGVSAAACVAVPDDLRGEEVKVYVVRVDPESASPSPTELFDWCAERLAYFKVPRYWAFLPALPRTPSERVAKGTLVIGVDDLTDGAFDMSAYAAPSKGLWPWPGPPAV
ncbi:MAG: AMP-binding protein [Acidimicrobiales bacterium]